MSDDATRYGPPVPVAVEGSTAETDIVERLRNRAFRLAVRDFNGDGASLAKDAADEILRLRALLRMQSKANAEHIKVAQAEITKLRAELAEAEAVIKPFADDGKDVDFEDRSIWGDDHEIALEFAFSFAEIRRARKWLEGRKG